MNNQFILNNEPGKQCHLENLGSILVFESLVWLCHSNAGHHPSQGAQAIVSRQPSGRVETTQEDFLGSGLSPALAFWGARTETSHVSDHWFCRKKVRAQRRGLRTYLRAWFVGFFSSALWVPALDCSCLRATSSLEGGFFQFS